VIASPYLGFAISKGRLSFPERMQKVSFPVWSFEQNIHTFLG